MVNLFWFEIIVYVFELEFELKAESYLGDMMKQIDDQNRVLLDMDKEYMKRVHQR